ncbi:MAG: HDOD domain-containing protein [Nitrospirae bacterium]|nr:HDOD domain-containing protein [Nitrospirota bacterium]
MNESLKLRVRQIEKLPTLPVIAQQILSLVGDDTVSVNKLEKIIENDPAISAKVLSVANSAFFKAVTPAATLGNAIFRIGFNNVKDIALGISVMTVLSDGGRDTEIDYYRVFNHSVSVGFTAGLLAQRLNLDLLEEILMNGILHDIGYLVLNKYFIDSYRKVTELFEKNNSLLEAEKEIFDFTHADIGAWLAEKWNLPDTVLDTTLYHHAPSLAKNNLKHVAVIHIADYLTTKNIFRPTKNDPNYPFDPSSLEALGMSEKDFKEMEAKISVENLSDEVV